LIVAVCAAIFNLAAMTGVAQPARQLPGHVPDVIRRLRPVRDLDPTTKMQLAIGLPLRNKLVLTNLIEDLYKPGNPQFHQYLTPAQFTARFGASEADYHAVEDYLRSCGLTVTATHPNRMVLDVAGAATDVEKAFHVHLRVFAHPTEHRTFFAPDTPPWVEANVPLLDVMGLDNYILPHPLDLQEGKRVGAGGANVTNYAETGSGPNGAYIAKDFRAAYVPGVTNTGVGQYIGLVEFGPYWTNDIHTYEVAAGLSTNIVVSNIFLDGVTEPPTAGLNAGEQAIQRSSRVVVKQEP
jgi:subtilase family serine protease